MRRRTLLTTLGSAAVGVTSGCLEALDREDEGREAGEALEPMEMVTGIASETKADGVEWIGAAETRDVVAPVGLVEGFGDVTDGPYLVVSPRTLHNDYCLPFASVSSACTRAGKTVFDGRLTETIDPTLGHHYGAPLEPIEDGDELTVGLESPPQFARHEGYETAFLESGFSVAVDR
ncbi:DUF7350 domain-containing protein [Natronobacterium texcoconense]|uniref:DUF7350 domain-containing protein n=1 Tax=Natronobacterium texcoconense TaxID=1095778 RepID=UPI000AFA23BF|nr:hypothetical protein [Natronobacterium texcoconense]